MNSNLSYSNSLEKIDPIFLIEIGLQQTGLAKKATCLRGRGRGRGRSAEWPCGRN